MKVHTRKTIHVDLTKQRHVGGHPFCLMEAASGRFKFIHSSRSTRMIGARSQTDTHTLSHISFEAAAAAAEEDFYESAIKLPLPPRLLPEGRRRRRRLRSQQVPIASTKCEQIMIIHDVQMSQQKMESLPRFCCYCTINNRSRNAAKKKSFR